MRTRSVVALSVLTLSALALAGCSGTGGEKPNADDSALCAAAAPSGKGSESIKIEGKTGEPSKATFSKPLEIKTLERTVLVEGSGDAITEDSLVSYALSAFNAESGDELGTVGYGDGLLLPSQIAPESALGQVLGCATVGSRIVATFPSSVDAPGEVYIMDVLDTVPSAAWGEPQDPKAGMPTVTLGKDGAPTVAIPDAPAPDAIEISGLQQGDGPAVKPNDTTLLQYYGVDWATGESFDSSWSRGAPYSNPGNNYVPGFVQALDGQTVGSQVLVVIPPALAYGEAGSSDHQLAGATLVFVIDILATAQAAS